MSDERRFHDHFSGVSGGYAVFRPRYPAALFDYLASLVPRESLVWDCAAGTGQASVDLAARFPRVIATDASAQQIASAAPHPRIEYRVALAEKSGLPDRSVTLLTIAQALHWLDLGRFWPEAKRVLQPGGVFAAWGYGPAVLEGEEVDRLVREYHVVTVGPYWPPERVIVENGYREISFPFEELSPPGFSMQERWTLDQLLGYLGTWSSTTRYRQAMGKDPLIPLAEALRVAWGNGGVPRRISWPLALRVGRNA